MNRVPRWTILLLFFLPCWAQAQGFSVVDPQAKEKKKQKEAIEEFKKELLKLKAQNPNAIQPMAPNGMPQLPPGWSEPSAQNIRPEQLRQQAEEYRKRFESLNQQVREIEESPVLQNAKYIWNHPARTKVLFAQIMLFFALIIFRNWRLSRYDQSEWGKRLAVTTWTGVMYFAIAGYLLPVSLFGTQYRDLLVAVFHQLSGNQAALTERVPAQKQEKPQWAN